MSDLQAHFDRLFSADRDPWKYRSSWPERRRLDLIMAMLFREFYDSIFEPACASGSLTERLASRAGRVVAWDGSQAAIMHAQRLLAPHPHVVLQNKSVPDQWPDMPVDLVILSDFLYYLPKQSIVDVAVLADRTVRPAGSIIGCHWRGTAHDFCVPGGDAVHAVLTEVLGTPAASYLDDRHVIDVWSP